MSKKIAELNKLISTLPKERSGEIALFIESTLDLLKTCYEKSGDKHYQNLLKSKITYPPLKSFITGNSYRGKSVEIDSIAYDKKTIEGHIEDGLPKHYNRRSIEIYNFYFGGYKILFQSFTKEFLKRKIGLDALFLEDIFSESKSEIIEVTYESKAQISGATIINEEFINTIKSGKAYTMSEFYGAKLNNCQWYGIINNFDVIRNEYQNLKNAVIDSFNHDKNYKVSAWVLGDGGSGKSTVLKRLSHDLGCEELFIVVWVYDIEEFIEQGFPIIKENIEKEHNQRFLIIIEDWYRMFDEKTLLGKKYLEEIHKTDNVRLVIGDRKSVDKPYKKYGNDFELFLSSDENQEIIEGIIEKYPNWKQSSEKLFEKKESYKSTLFLLLFILARITPNENDKSSFNFSDPQIVFRNIIESDLNSIPKKYIGLAMALYYWGCFYAQHKIHISYDTFLKLADFYNGKDNNKIRDLFSRWNMKDDVLDKLKIYINKNYRIDRFNTSDLVKFNHDILPDMGLSQLSFKKWDKFSDSVKIELLHFITEKGDDYSASRFLQTMLQNESHLFNDLEDKLSFIKRLIENGNQQPHYIYVLTGFSLDNQKLNEFAKLFWERKIYSTVFWGSYFRKVENDTVINTHISEILSITNLSDYDFNFICSVLKYTENANERNRFVKEILKEDQSYIIHPKIINSCLDYATDDVKQSFFKKTIDDNNWVVINDSFKHYLNSLDDDNMEYFIHKVLYEDQWKSIETYNLSSFFEYSKDEIRSIFSDKVLSEEQKELGTSLLQECFTFASAKIKQKFSNRVLKNNEWIEYSDRFICTCLKYVTEDKQLKFSNYLLSDYNWNNAGDSLIYKSMLIADENIKEVFSNVFLNDEYSDKLKINVSLFRSCFYYATHLTKQNFSNRFFQDTETLWKLKNKFIIYSCIEHTTKDNIKKYFYSTILRTKKWYSYDSQFIYNCLKFFEGEEKISSALSLIITSIINEFHHKSFSSKRKMKNPSFVRREKNRSTTHYLLLLKVNFYNHPIWRQETNNIIQNWHLKNKKVVASVLYSYRSRPDEIYNICSIFLSQGRTNVYSSFSRTNGYMNILKIALGHPKLKEQSKQTANQILHDLQENEKLKIPKDLENILTQIVESNIYPEWKF